MPHEKTVLILCTGNSCRSQMAEVLLNHALAGSVKAISAGTRPQSQVAMGAIEALKLGGLPTDGLHPKDIDAVMDHPIDLVVTVCDNAKANCPYFPAKTKLIHHAFHDPYFASGDFEERVAAFAKVRDQIAEFIDTELVDQLKADKTNAEARTE